MKKLIITFLAIATLGAVNVSAQGKYGADSAECIKYLSYYKEYFKQKNYDSATPNWREAFRICPPTANQTCKVHAPSRDYTFTFTNGVWVETVNTAIVDRIETFRPDTRCASLIDERQIVVVDPMLATGGSAIAAVDSIKKREGKKIKFMSIIAAPEGVGALMQAHPDIQLYVGCLDRCLNENAYICPGLGDAGDRIFGTL